MASSSTIKRLDKVFSQFIRLRDSSNGYFVCCSCGKTKPYEQGDAGHFINRRWMALRWREDNVHMQCRYCNRFDEGNAAGYTLFMLRKYGEDHINLLMSMKTPHKWTDSELEVLIKEYRAKIKQNG